MTLSRNVSLAGSDFHIGLTTGRAILRKPTWDLTSCWMRFIPTRSLNSEARDRRHNCVHRRGGWAAPRRVPSGGQTGSNLSALRTRARPQHCLRTYAAMAESWSTVEHIGRHGPGPSRIEPSSVVHVPGSRLDSRPGQVVGRLAARIVAELPALVRGAGCHGRQV